MVGEETEGKAIANTRGKETMARGKGGKEKERNANHQYIFGGGEGVHEKARLIKRRG